MTNDKYERLRQALEKGPDGMYKGGFEPIGGYGELILELLAEREPVPKCELCVARPGTETFAVAPLIARGSLGPAWKDRSTVRVCDTCSREI